MKKLAVVSFCIACSINTLAQTTSGTISLGGSLGVVTGTNRALSVERKNTSVSITPTVGYFVSDNMELGLNLWFSYERDKADGDDLGSSKTAGLGPYFKYYLYTNNESFAFTLNASAFFAISKRDNPPSSPFEDATGNRFQISLSPGFSYFFTKKIGLDFELQGLPLPGQILITKPMTIKVIT